MIDAAMKNSRRAADGDLDHRQMRNPIRRSNRHRDFDIPVSIANRLAQMMWACDIDPSTGNQTTTYIYGVSTATGSTITSDSLLYQTDYPGLTGGPAQRVTNSYNATGDVVSTTDRNGNVHQYNYDTAGREISDTVTTLGAGVDGSVRRIDTAYNNQGLAYPLTSYADTAGTQIVNQVENTYNGLGQLAFQYQALTAAVDVSTTPGMRNGDAIS